MGYRIQEKFLRSVSPNWQVPEDVKNIYEYGSNILLSIWLAIFIKPVVKVILAVLISSLIAVYLLFGKMPTKIDMMELKINTANFAPKIKNITIYPVYILGLMFIGYLFYHQMYVIVIGIKLISMAALVIICWKFAQSLPKTQIWRKNEERLKSAKRRLKEILCPKVEFTD